MASELEICNMALAILGQTDISSLKEDTQSARLCNQYYDSVRKQLLRAHDWGFSKTRDKLIKLGQEEIFGGFEYYYAKPTKALFITAVFEKGEAIKKRRFKMFYKPSLNQEVISTNAENAYVEYVRDVEDTTLYDSLFVEAFSAALATKIAMSLTGSTDLYQMAYQTYKLTLDEARYSNKVEQLDEVVYENPYLSSRG